MKSLYLPGHPVIVVQLLTVAKLMENTQGQNLQIPVAIAALRSTISAAEIGFGKGGGQIGAQARTLFTNLEQTLHQLRLAG